MSNYQILALGDPYVDRILRVSDEFLSAIPGDKGGTLEITYPTLVNLLSTAEGTPEIIPGGSAANTIRALAYLNHPCALLGKLGNDDLADHFLKELKQLSITPLLKRANKPTGQVICLVTPDGDRTQRTLVGSAGTMVSQDVRPEYFEGVRLAHIEGYSLRNGELPRHTMKLAKQAGATVSMDLAAFELVDRHRPMVEDLIQRYVDILFCNALEAEALTGTTDEEAAVEYLGSFCDIAVITMSERGCWVKYDKKRFHLSTQAIHPTDSTGAGDYFAAGFLHGWLQDASPLYCAKVGSVIARTVIGNIGPVIHKHQWDKLLIEIQEILLESKKACAQ